MLEGRHLQFLFTKTVNLLVYFFSAGIDFRRQNLMSVFMDISKDGPRAE